MKDIETPDKEPAGEDNNNNDKLTEHYGSILRESSLLMTVAGILFGFLLNISVNSPSEFTDVNKALLMIALFSITVSTLSFSMPVIYHHIQYPYKRFEKFQQRSHRFIVFGIIPFIVTLYISLSSAILLLIQRSMLYPSENAYSISFSLSSMPFIILILLYLKRK